MIGSQRAPSGMKPKPRPLAPKPPQLQPRQEKKVVVPTGREPLSPELEAEVAAAFGAMSLDDALAGASGAAAQELEPESRQTAKVVSIRSGDVFVEIGRHQGVLPLAQFSSPPEIGAMIPVVVQSLEADEGLYKLSLPGGASAVGDWSSVAEGMVVEARITGHNKGGLECEVAQLRGFIPASQVAPYRVDDLSQFGGEKWNCLVTEVAPERRKLVLSRRAVLEREQEEARQRLKQELAEGQVREGTVRSIQDFGAFVDLGGVDGLLHVSQLGWQRVKHPSEVLSVGQRVKVAVRKIDQASGKISLGMRDLMANPWDTAAVNYHPGDVINGRVTRVADFGAFVELEPGIEGLVHVSELAHKRVFRVRDVVNEGDSVEAKIVSVDPQARRIGLSIKAVQLPQQAKPVEAPAEEEVPSAEPPKPRSNKPLKGGIGRSTGGEPFGLKW